MADKVGSTFTVLSVFVIIFVVLLAIGTAFLMMYLLGVIEGLDLSQEEPVILHIEVSDGDTTYAGPYSHGDDVVEIEHKPGTESIDWSKYTIYAFKEDEPEGQGILLEIVTLGELPYDNSTNSVSYPGWEMKLTVAISGSLSAGTWIRIRVFEAGEELHVSRDFFVS